MSETNYDLPFYFRYPIKIFSYFPAINTTLGLIAYTTMIYFIYLVLLLIQAFWNIKNTRARIQDEQDFKKNLEDLRKVKTVEANKLLKNMFGNRELKQN